jgi:hypothetical protein
MPATVALHCAAALGGSEEGVQAAVTDVMGRLDLELLLPPQAMRTSKNRDAPKAHAKKCLTGLLVRWRRELLM